MLAQDELVELYRAHRSDDVLSVYLDADQHDPAQRRKWRVVLKNLLSEERARAGDPTAFDQALAHLDRVLDNRESGFLEGRGWAGFATPSGLLYAEGLPVPMPNLVRWEAGLRVAPYARVLKQARPVVAALIDSRRARLLRYRMGMLTDREYLEADTHLGDLTDVNQGKRPSTHSGIRGETATDAAQRFLDVERDRLIARVADEIRSEAGADGFIVLGGARRSVDALAAELADVPEERITTRPGLTFDLSDAELRSQVESGASELSERVQARLLERVIAQARAGGDACLGQEETERALVEMRVDTLLVSDTLRDRSPDRADHLEGAAFEQGASVVELSRAPAERLDSEGEGVGALLRYRIQS